MKRMFEKQKKLIQNGGDIDVKEWRIVDIDDHLKTKYKQWMNEWFCGLLLIQINNLTLI